MRGGEGDADLAMNELAYTSRGKVSNGKVSNREVSNREVNNREVRLYERWGLTFADREVQPEEDEVVGHPQPL